MNQDMIKSNEELKQEEKREYIYVVAFFVLLVMVIGFTLLIAKLKG